MSEVYLVFGILDVCVGHGVVIDTLTGLLCQKYIWYLVFWMCVLGTVDGGPWTVDGGVVDTRTESSQLSST